MPEDNMVHALSVVCAFWSGLFCTVALAFFHTFYVKQMEDIPTNGEAQASGGLSNTVSLRPSNAASSVLVARKDVAASDIHTNNTLADVDEERHPLILKKADITKACSNPEVCTRTASSKNARGGGVCACFSDLTLIEWFRYGVSIFAFYVMASFGVMFSSYVENKSHPYRGNLLSITEYTIIFILQISLMLLAPALRHIYVGVVIENNNEHLMNKSDETSVNKVSNPMAKRRAQSVH